MIRKLGPDSGITEKSSIKKKGKLDELKCILKSIPTTIHIILLSETWIASEDQASQLQIENYKHYYNFRTDARGGGVSAYVHNNLKHRLIESTYQGGNNYLWVHIEQCAVDIGLLYKPGDTNFEQFIKDYDSQLQQRKRSIVFGDFNINLLENNKRLTEYKQIIQESGHRLLNKIHKSHCTRDSTTKKSIIDHVSTNLKTNNFNVAIINSSFSDHKNIYVQLNKFKTPNKIRTTYESIDYTKLYRSLDSTQLINSIKNYTELENLIKQHFIDCKETKTKILNNIRDDWINKDIIDGISQRNFLWTQYKNNPSNEYIKTKFYSKRTEIAELIQSTKDLYYYKLFTNNTKNPKKTWTLVNKLCMNKTNQSCAPSKIKVESKIISDIKDICNVFDKYFATIGSLLAKKIPTQYHNILHPIHTINEHNNHELKTFKPCSSSEIERLIGDLDSNASTGIDKISTKALKCLCSSISKSLAHCFNKLMSEGIFPDSLKIAKITPIHKSGSLLDPENYRPISVLPVLSKILEKLIHNRLVTYLDSFDFISERQYGFRARSNTTAATVDLVTKIRQNLDRKNIALGVFIDLKKAFDTVSHKLLLQKLKNIGVKSAVLEMLKSYLTNRLQVVKIGDIQSSALPVTCGVPQGSILGPLLFFIYVNDIATLKLNGHLTLYADDTCLFYFGSNINDIIAQAQQDLDVLHKWFNHNLLTINASKTCYIEMKDEIMARKLRLCPDHDFQHGQRRRQVLNQGERENS
ncbi:uncharacterized protein LOC123657621 [Melitaea cinxia]|uniref:uncharacterized protein LOC123657621 n=1 Tax=Melitaea cinxia TaxID=113334 RepID=UPI001E270070|nr:uncharacterized protein LOC123657621 [Melitaea cinxia]